MQNDILYLITNTYSPAGDFRRLLGTAPTATFGDGQYKGGNYIYNSPKLKSRERSFSHVIEECLRYACAAASLRSKCFGFLRAVFRRVFERIFERIFG